MCPLIHLPVSLLINVTVLPGYFKEWLLATSLAPLIFVFPVYASPNVFYLYQVLFLIVPLRKGSMEAALRSLYGVLRTQDLKAQICETLSKQPASSSPCNAVSSTEGMRFLGRWYREAWNSSAQAQTLLTPFTCPAVSQCSIPLPCHYSNKRRHWVLSKICICPFPSLLSSFLFSILKIELGAFTLSYILFLIFGTGSRTQVLALTRWALMPLSYISS